MKPKPSTSTLRFVLALAILVGGAQTILSAQSPAGGPTSIVGVWDVQVNLLNCNTGDLIASFPALHKYELGGTLQVVPSTNPAVLSAHVGVWKATSKDHYDMAFKMFRFDGAGNNIGWAVLRNDIAISKDATLYAGSGQATFYDLNGNPVGVSCPTFTGTRFK
jgi:hypothetical protein